jgi:tetratricopeptide (TPR) repeat protein
MSAINKNYDRREMIQDSSFGVRFFHLNIYFCTLLLVSCGFNIACCQTDYDEIDPTLLLTADNQQDQRDIADVEIASHAELLTSPAGITASRLIAGLPQPVVAIAINLAAEANQNQPQNMPSPVEAPSKKLERDLWQSRITALPEERDSNKTDDLKKMVDQVRCVKFEQRKPAQQSASEPAVEISAPAANAAVMQADEPATTGEIIDEQTLKIIESRLKDPNQISNPFELAEILFKSGRQTEAGICYKQALKLLPADDPNAATERAWILFQTGNCLKDEDPNTARDSYAELIRTHSDSPWAELAKTRYGLIEWKLQERPEELIRQPDGLKK